MELYETYNAIGGSDCEIIFNLLKQNKTTVSNLCKLIDGDFAFIYKDNTSEIVARDPIGVRPLFYGVNASDGFDFCSELLSSKFSSIAF